MSKIFKKTHNPFVLCAATHSLNLRDWSLNTGRWGYKTGVWGGDVKIGFINYHLVCTQLYMLS